VCLRQIMKKILYLITQSDFGGAQRYVYDLATNISVKYNIIIGGGEQGAIGELAKKLQNQDVKYINITHLKRAINPYHDILALWQIIQIIIREKPDIIHLNSTKISVLGSLAGKIYLTLINRQASMKIIYTVHGWVFNENINYYKKIIYKKLERLTARYKDKIICLSELDKKNAIENKIQPRGKLIVIYNGREQIKFLSRQEARQKLNIASDVIAIGSIGNLYKNKGYNYLIEMFQFIKNTRYKIFIIGEGCERNNLEKSIKKLKLNNNINLFGNLIDASQYLKAFDIYICASVKEGLPYSILEAMQAGLPIVSTKVGSITEVIAESQSGLLIEPKNPQALAEKIKYLIDNPETAKKLGEQAKKDVVKKFSLKQMITETEKIYQL